MKARRLRNGRIRRKKKRSCGTAEYRLPQHHIKTVKCKTYNRKLMSNVKPKKEFEEMLFQNLNPFISQTLYYLKL